MDLLYIHTYCIVYRVHKMQMFGEVSITYLDICNKLLQQAENFWLCMLASKVKKCENSHKKNTLSCKFRQVNFWKLSIQI